MNKYNVKLLLKITPANNKEILLDFNRLRFKNTPPTKSIKSIENFELMDRDSLVIDIYNKFSTAENSHSTLETLYNFLILHFRYSDNNSLIPLEKESMMETIHNEFERYKKGEIKSSLYIKAVSECSSISKLLEIKSNWINELPRLHKNDVESFESYSKEELKILLPPLRKLFSQLSKQFLEDPDKHMSASRNKSTMIFEWKGREYIIYSGISKIMASAAFLLSYYTWANTSVLFSLKRPKSVSYDMSKDWYIMPAFKRRAFKTISVEFESNHKLEVPKFSISFFNTLLNISKLIDPSDDALLFQRSILNKRTKITSPMLTSFNQFVEKTLMLRGSDGKKISYQISRFRETGAQNFMVKEGSFETSLLLDNNPDTVKRHYSKGNKIENQAMMQDSTSILEIQSRNKEGVSKAIEQRKSEINVKLLTLEEKHSNITKSMNGTYCSSPFGKESKSFTKVAQSHKLIKSGEKLACADLLKCFSCQHQVIVQSEHDIWCLLSFKESIEDSISFHVDANHFNKNFHDIIIKINEIIKRIDGRILRKSERLMVDNGRHPLWESHLILNKLKGI
ncbi:hypothetical protein H4F17_12765 [Vibrio cholerae]